MTGSYSNMYVSMFRFMYNL